MKKKKIIMAVLIFVVLFAVVFTSHLVAHQKKLGELIEQSGNVKEIIFANDVYTWNGAESGRVSQFYTKVYKIKNSNVNFKNCLQIVSDFKYNCTDSDKEKLLLAPSRFIIIVFTDKSYIIFRDSMNILKYSAGGSFLSIESISSPLAAIEKFNQLYEIKILGELTIYEPSPKPLSTIWEED